jgi:hypothetical protein
MSALILPTSGSDLSPGLSSRLSPRLPPRRVLSPVHLRALSARASPRRAPRLSSLLPLLRSGVFRLGAPAHVAAPDPSSPYRAAALCSKGLEAAWRETAPLAGCFVLWAVGRSTVAARCDGSIAPPSARLRRLALDGRMRITLGHWTHTEIGHTRCDPKVKPHGKLPPGAQC